MKKLSFSLLTLVVILLAHFLAYPQNPEWLNYTNGNKRIRPYWVGLAKFNGVNWATYSTSNSGLPDSWITSIAIDSSDNKWIGTYYGGLAKFDGTNWTTYNRSNSGLPANYVQSIAIDDSGKKWIGTHNGLAKFDGTNWTIYTMSNSALPDNYIRSIAIDGSGDKWIGTYGGLAKFDGTIWTTYIRLNSDWPDNDVWSIAIDDSGNKWLGTWGGLAKFDGTNWTTYTTPNSGLPHHVVKSIAIDSKGNKWIGTGNFGLAKFDGTNWTTYTTSNSGLPSNDMYSIAIDDSGNAWIGTFGGLAKFDGQNWTTYTTSNSGLPCDYVYSIAFDGSGNKWIGTFGGLAVYNEGGIHGPVIQLLREFSLIEPRNDATVNTVHPLFRWQQSSDMKEYYPWELTFDLYIDTSSSFSHPQIIKDIQDTVYTSNSLAEGKTYFWKVLAKNLAGDSLWSTQQDWGFFIKPGATLVENADIELPQNFELFQNYPNPFNSSTEIKYSLPNGKSSSYPVQLKIYDVLGRLVKVLLNQEQLAGSYAINWDGTDLGGNRVASGVYFYCLEAGDLKSIRKMLVLQ
jgi:hypothetical protein